MNDEPLTEDLDLSGDDFEKMDQEIKVSPGWHPAYYTGAHFDDKGNLKLDFEIAAPDREEGRRTKLTLWGSNKEFNHAHKKAIAKRLGLVKQSDAGRTASINWNATVGNLFVIHVVVNKGKDGDQDFREVKSYGVYPPDHEKVPKEHRIASPHRDSRAAERKTAEDTYGNHAQRI